MKTTTVEHTTLQIFAGTLRNTINGFLIDRKTRGVSERTIEFYTVELKYFTRFLDNIGVVDMTEINPDVVRKYLLDVSTHRNKGGVHCSYRVVKAFLNWWQDETDSDFLSPMKKIKVSSGNSQPIPGVTTEELVKLIEACNTDQGLRDKTIFYFLFDSGVRANEMLSLNIEDLDLISGNVVIRHGKGDKFRIVFIGSKTRKSLRAYLKTRQNIRLDSPLFVTDEGERITFSGLRQIVRRCSNRARIKNHGLHDFRRGSAQNLLKNGCNLITIQKILGHSSLVVTQRYLAQSEVDLQEEYKKSSPVDRL